MPIPKLIVTAALMAAQVALQMTQKTKGPRLDSLKTTTAEYGTPINRFWGKRKFDCPIIMAEDLLEKKKTSKGKAGKMTEYKYYATFAVLIADHEIEGVTRIWFDDKLVYDATGAGAFSVASLFSDRNGVRLSPRNMRIYKGTEDQLPDPRMEAWCEDRYGPDSCPAYRGSSYVFFEELPVNNFGNRIPNITIEAVSALSDAYPYDTETAVGSSTNSFAINGTWMARYTGAGVINWWDLGTRTLLGTSAGPGVLSGTVINIALANDGTGYFMGGRVVGVDVIWAHYSVSPVGVPTKIADLDDPRSYSYTRVFDLDSGRIVLTACEEGYFSGATFVAGSRAMRDFCIDTDGAVWAIAQTPGADDKFYLVNMDTGIETEFTGTARAALSQAYVCFSVDHFVVVTDGNFYIIDADSMTITASGARGWDNEDLLPTNDPYATSFWDGYEEWSLADGSLIRTVNSLSWVAQDSFRTAYDPINHAIIARPQFTSVLTWRFLDRISSNGVTLQTIVDDVSDWCGVTGQDTSALTQTVLGYSVTQGAGKDMIAPLLDVYDVDCRPHDFQVQFVNRGSAPSGSIVTSDFVKGDPRYKVSIQQDTDLPKEITINFADTNHDQNTNTAIASRPLDATDSKRTESIDLSTFVDTADGAQQKVDRYFRRQWNSRERVTNAITAQKLGLEPADVTTIYLDGIARNVRLEKMTIRGSSIDCEWVRDETAFAVLNSATGAPLEGSDVDVIVLPSLTKGFILDIPLVEDADADINPLLYVAAGSYGGTWAGAEAYRGDDGTYDELVAAIESDNATTWGTATDALATANANLWDRGNSVSVTVFGTLTSSTEAAIDADPSLNLCALGDAGRWEVLNFTTATLTGTSGNANTYTLSGFKRGRRGTEGNVGSHAAGDTLVMLNMAHVTELGLGDVGDALSYKIQSVGRDIDLAAANDLTFAGATLKPYAPARVKWTTDGTDLFGEIIRRTRVGGSWNGGSTIPLSENSEAYEVDVYVGATFKRTIAVSGTNTFTYTAAMMASDGTSLTSQPIFYAYQISDTVGRGFALAA